MTWIHWNPSNVFPNWIINFPIENAMNIFLRFTISLSLGNLGDFFFVYAHFLDGYGSFYFPSSPSFFLSLLSDSPINLNWSIDPYRNGSFHSVYIFVSHLFFVILLLLLLPNVCVNRLQGSIKSNAIIKGSLRSGMP